MSRLSQQNPQNYTSSAPIHAEFENIVRYINVAELGNKTIGELLTILFDENGVFDGPIELRLDSTAGFQYRIGEFDATEDGWITMATHASMRGVAGQSVGTIEGPFFFGRVDITASSGQTVFPYVHDAVVTALMVFVNGVLQDDVTSNYTHSAAADTVTFGSGITLNDVVTIYSIREQSVTNHRRSDLTATSGQAVFAFVHTAEETLFVFRNGIFQQPGGSNDYTASFAGDTVTFTSGLVLNDLVTIMTVENLTLQVVAGMMFEDEYTTNGLINYAKLNVATDDIAQAKVVGLVTALASAAKITAAGSTPGSPATKDLWLDTSQTPNQLKFYDGTQFLTTSPASTLPTFEVSNAGEYVRVNGTGTALEYGDIDFSTHVPKTYISAANGVASLDAAGRIPILELPQIFAVDTKAVLVAGAVTNGDIFISRMWRQTDRYDGIAAVLSAGTCTLQLQVNGTPVGSTYAVSATLADITFGTIIEIDGTTASKLIEIVVTSASSAADLEVGLSTATAAV